MTPKEDKFVVKNHDIRVDSDYMAWLNEIKARYNSARAKAAVKVNVEQLLFNWQMGRDLVSRKAEERWGTGIVEQLSLDLQAAFPESKGFSVRNLWYMKQWYSFYTNNKQKLHQLGGELQLSDNHINAKFKERHGDMRNEAILHPLGAELPDVFALVPWRHHVEILSRCKLIEEAFFYVVHAATGGWSRNTLINNIKADYYHTSGGAITNFNEILSGHQSKLAQAITKDTYDFGFMTLNNDYEEEELESELERQLTRFLLELGSGFAYLGRQKQIIVAGKTRRLDMLFFHIPLNCYIVVELKAVPFQPEFTGKLNFYVNAVDDLIKTPAQNPTIGLLICSDKEETEVQYAFKGIHTPIGVSSYSNIQVKRIQDQLPSVEKLKERIRLLEKELEKRKQSRYDHDDHRHIDG